MAWYIYRHGDFDFTECKDKQEVLKILSEVQEEENDTEEEMNSLITVIKGEEIRITTNTKTEVGLVEPKCSCKGGR